MTPESLNQPQPHQNQQQVDQPPTTAEEYFIRGLKSAQMGFPDKAAQDFEEAAWLDPEDPKIQFNLGTAYLSIGMFEQAIINFNRTLELDPHNSDALGNRAVARTAIGEDQLAQQDVKQAIKLGAPPDGLNAVLQYVKQRRKPNTL